MTANGTFHQHIIQELRTLIRGGGFSAGSKFLTEREIAGRFKTSRPTANKALSSLVSEGALEVRRGAGTFVREAGLDYNLERLISFTDKARSAGKKPETQLIEYRKIRSDEAPFAIVQALQLDPGTPLVYMERRRLADGKPVIYEKRHVFSSLCPQMTRSDAKGSLYACWTGKCGLPILGADEVIHAINANAEQAASLGIATGAACFRICATGFTTDQKPLWHEETLYRADVYEFRNRISGLSSAALGRIKG